MNVIYKHWYRIIIAITALLALQTVRADAHLSLDDYEKQVTEKSLAVHAATLRAKAGSGRAGEGARSYVPSFVAAIQQTSDKRPVFNPAFQGTKNEVQYYSLGLSQLTPWGMKAALSYNVMRTEFTGTSPVFVPVSTFYDAYPKIELNQSLWGNFFGASTRASIDAADSSADADGEEATYAIKSHRYSTELTYLRLVLARKTVDVRKSTLERAVGIRDWANRRVKMHLADRSDLLQAEAALKMRELDLQAASDEERSAAREFNTVRHVDSDLVAEELQDLRVEEVTAIAAPKRSDVREDVKAAQSRSKAAAAQAVIAREAVAPKLDASAFYSLYGRNAAQSTAISNSVESTHPYWQIGVSLNMPLDFSTQNTLRQARNSEREAADLQYRETSYNSDREWNSLSRNYEEYRRQLELAVSLEKIQKEKLAHEKDRLEKGRTTTYQVLLFEQDYSAAQYTSIQSQSQHLRNIIKMKLWSNL